MRVEDARFQQLLVSYRDTVLKAAQEVEDALAGFLNSQQAMVFEQNAVTAAQRSVELALVQYREGAIRLPARAGRATFAAASSRRAWPSPARPSRRT